MDGPDSKETSSQGHGALNQRKNPFLILDLPYDIVYVVFLHCWSQPADKERYPHFPIAISHVCRLWRQYALDTSRFWTTLTFREPLPATEKYNVWLERSKDAPFDLDIGWQPFERAAIKHAKAIMRLVVPHAQRMRSLQVERAPLKIRRLIFDRLDEIKCPALETLQIKKEWFTLVIHPQQRTFRPFRKGGAPQLQEITLGRIPYQYFIHQFRELRLLDVASGDIFGPFPPDNAQIVQTILSLLPNLQKLRIDREFWPGSPAPTNTSDMRLLQLTVPPITHERLQELFIIASQPDTNAIIASIILPSLRYLHRDEDGLPVGACCLPILAQPIHQQHPFPRLINLRLAGGHHPDLPSDPTHSSHMTFLGGALAGLPHLERLNLEQVHFEGNKHLACLSNSCPRLKVLVLFCCSGFTVMELRSVILRRGEISGLDPLNFVSVEDPWSYRIRRLAEEAAEQGWEGNANFHTGAILHRIVLVGSE